MEDGSDSLTVAGAVPGLLPRSGGRTGFPFHPEDGRPLGT